MRDFPEGLRQVVGLAASAKRTVDVDADDLRYRRRPGRTPAGIMAAPVRPCEESEEGF